MTRNKIHVFLPAAALALCALLAAAFSPQASAQTQTPSSAPLTAKIIKRQFSVVHMFPQSLQVAKLDNPRDLITFDYSPDIRDKMLKLFIAGGFQYGDRVTVWYHQNTDLALKVKGKSSKPKVAAKETK